MDPESAEAASDAPSDAGRRTGRTIALAVAAVAVAALAFLAGSGAFDGWFDADAPGEVRWEDALAVAGDESDGVLAQVLVVDDGDRSCARVSLGDRTLVVVSQARCAEHLTPWDDPDFRIVRLDDYFGSFGQYPVQRSDGSWRVALAGSVHPDVVRVTAHFGDGGQYSFVTRNPDGWFVALVPVEVADPDRATGYLVNAPVRLELFDGDGTRVASVDLTTEIGRTPGAA